MEVSIEIAGERLLLLPERAVLWERERTLLVADTHWGKAAAFRAGGFAVPGGTTAGGLARLDEALGRTRAERLVFLGDFLHAREGRTEATLERLQIWRESRRELEMLLVRGNHDKGAGDPPEALAMRCLDPPVLAAPFVFSHRPGTHPEGYVLAGHVHPAVRLSGAGRQRKRLPCFLFGRGGAVLPAFGEFTGCADVTPGPEERTFVPVDGTVVEVPGRRR